MIAAAGARRQTRSRVGGGGTVAVRAVAYLIDLAVAAGVPRDLVIDAATAADLHRRDPDDRLPLSSALAIWQTLAAHPAEPGLGVRLGAALQVRQLGLLGYVIWFSATLRDALQRVQRYGALFTQEVGFTLEDGRPEAGFTMQRHAPGVEQPIAQEHALAAVVQVCRELTGVEIVPTDVHFTFPQPPNTATYRQFFRCRLHFATAGARIVFRATDLDRRLTRADEQLAGYLGKYAEEVLGSLVDGGTVRHSVHAVIWSLLGDGAPSLTRVAEAMRIRPRTLQRHLAAEGTSLHHEIEAVRRTMALAVLRDRSIPIHDVALLLGYSEPSAFFKSFKRWTGTTPRRFRRAGSQA